MRDETVRDETKRNFSYSLSHPSSLVVSSLLFVSSLISYPSSLVFSATSLGALRQGDPVRGFSAKSLALGGAAILSDDDAAVIFSNPASLSGVKSRIEFSVSPGFSNHFYRRVHQDNSYVSDSRTSFALQSFAVSARHPKLRILTLGIGWNSDFNYDFDCEEKSSRDRNDQNNSGIADGTDLLKIRGSQNEWSAGLAVEFFERLSVGASYRRISGSVKSETTLITQKPGQSWIIQEMESQNEFLGNSFLIGIAAKITPSFSAGAAVRPRYDVSISSVSSFVQGSRVVARDRAEMAIRMPEQFALGLQCQFIPGKTFLSADFYYTCWENLRNRVEIVNQAPVQIESNPFYRNTVDFHIGFEHRVTEKIPLRIGFYHLSDVLSTPRSSTPFFTLGTGYAWNNFSVDLAGSFGRRTTNQERLFWIGSRDEVTDSQFRFLTTFSYRWK